MEALKIDEVNSKLNDPSYLLTRLLGILSPHEIDNLTVVDENVVKDSSTSLLEQDLIGKAGKSSQAKILPFKKVHDEEKIETDQDYIDHLKDEDFHGFEEIIVEDGDPNDPQSIFKKKKIRVEKKMDLTTFIIREKRKLEASQKKLKEKEVLETYKKNASLDIEEEKKLKEDLSKSSKLGVLINKRQF